MDELVLGAVWYLALLFSLTFHEAAHAWAAKRGGDPTAYLGGQVSLDPRPHIRRETMGTVIVPLLSYALSGWMIGWASTPFDPRWAAAHPRRAGWMALAGPAANLLLVVAAGIVIRVGIFSGVFEPPHAIDFTHMVAALEGTTASALVPLVSVLFTLNLLLCVFNLIPLPPLDGAGVMALILPESAAERFRQTMANPTFALMGIVVAWFMIGSIFRPVHLFAVNLLYPELSYH
jgi:Zn-dependent protease